MPSANVFPPADSIESLPDVERRTAIRYDCRCRCLVRPADAASALSWPGMTANLSISGMMVALQHPLQNGTRLILEAWNAREAPIVEAIVVRSFPVGFAWFHGCEFIDPLSETGLELWLKSGVMRMDA
jgi:hypothetical protein